MDTSCMMSIGAERNSNQTCCAANGSTPKAPAVIRPESQYCVNVACDGDANKEDQHEQCKLCSENWISAVLLTDRGAKSLARVLLTESPPTAGSLGGGGLADPVCILSRVKHNNAVDRVCQFCGSLKTYCNVRRPEWQWRRTGGGRIFTELDLKTKRLFAFEPGESSWRKMHNVEHKKANGAAKLGYGTFPCVGVSLKRLPITRTGLPACEPDCDPLIQQLSYQNRAMVCSAGRYTHMNTFCIINRNPPVPRIVGRLG